MLCVNVSYDLDFVSPAAGKADQRLDHCERARSHVVVSPVEDLCEGDRCLHSAMFT